MKPEISQLVAIDANHKMARYDAACRAVEAAKSVDEVMEYINESAALRAYAKQAKNKQLELDAWEIRNRAERRLGEMILAQKETVGLSKGGGGRDATGARVEPVEAKPTLAEAGIDKKLSASSQKLAAIPHQEYFAKLAARRELFESGAPNRTSFTGENEWYTPAECVELARDALGGIDTDPASSEVAQRTVKAAAWFSEADNGLEREWHGKVFLNPPYAQPAISLFADKMVAEFESGRVEAAIMLTHNYTDTAWFQKLARAAHAICFTRGRVRFLSPSGVVAAPTQGQAYFYFGGNINIFSDVFAETGFVAEVRK
jgi:phage N-6-adenine-methyltransferase